MKFEIFKEFLLPQGEKFLPVKIWLRGITNDRLPVLGIVNTAITLEPLGDRSFSIEFYVVDDSACFPNMLLGRDFVAGQRLLLNYKITKTDVNGFSEQENIITQLLQI